MAQSAGASEDSNSISAECPGHDTKQSDGVAPVLMELWEMWNTPSFPSLGHLWWCNG